MVEILCPHCVEEIQLDDDASGVFACPHCDGEFEWNIRPEVEQLDEEDNLLLTVVSGFFSKPASHRPRPSCGQFGGIQFQFHSVGCGW